MKKALIIFLALAMVGAVFAAEPVAEVKVAEFTGNAAVTFGIDLDAGKTGFKNETSVTLKLNLMNGGDKSTTGNGVWGELVIKTDGDTFIKSEVGKVNQFPMKVKVDKAQINFGHGVYLGILSGDFDYGGDFWYPNSLNYKDDKDSPRTRKPSAKLDYDQGLVLGYKHDIVEIEAALRSKKDAGKTSYANLANPVDVSVKDTKYYAFAIQTDNTLKEVEKVGDGVKKVAELFDVATTGSYYTGKVTIDDNYWTNKYALGLKALVKPVKDLRIGFGLGYALGDLSYALKNTEDKAKGDQIIKDGDNKNDVTFFVGADYRYNINEKFFIQPVLTYTLYGDWKWATKDDKYYTTPTNFLGFGFRFGWSGSKGGNSLLGDFFGSNLVYNISKKDDGDRLPGVALWMGVDLNEKAYKKELPLMLTFYSGDIVKNLQLYALFGINAGPDAGKAAAAVAGDKVMYDRVIGAKGLQFGLGASYDIKVKEVTITPAAGLLVTHGKLEHKDSNTWVSADEVRAAVKVDVKGLVDNTTFTAAWENYAYGVGKDDKNGKVVETVKYGLFSLKIKIAF